jgi:excisionase family DNA binding protein
MALLTVKEAASRLGISTATAYLLCDRRRPAIRHHRLGTTGETIRIPEDALAEYLARSTVAPAAVPGPEATPRRPLRYIKLK